MRSNLSHWSTCRTKRACPTSSVKFTRPEVSSAPSLQGMLTQLRQRHGNGVNGCVMHRTRDTGARADVGARDAGHWGTDGRWSTGRGTLVHGLPDTGARAEQASGLEPRQLASTACLLLHTRQLATASGAEAMTCVESLFPCAAPGVFAAVRQLCRASHSVHQARMKLSLSPLRQLRLAYRHHLPLRLHVLLPAPAHGHLSSDLSMPKRAHCHRRHSHAQHLPASRCGCRERRASAEGTRAWHPSQCSRFDLAATPHFRTALLSVSKQDADPSV